MIVRIRPFLDVEKISDILVRAEELGADRITDFESAFASYIGSPQAIAVDRGRSALLLALEILGLKRGDEVIVQTYIFHVVIDAILEVGAKPVLVDSSLDDFNISAQAIKSGITDRTKAIIITHLGIPCDMEQIIDIAKAHDCFLIENCAHTLGAQYDGKNVGTFGDVSFFSFDVDKPFSTGDGGMLVINNYNLMDKASQILDQYKKIPLKKEKEIIYGLLLHHFVTDEEIYPEKGFLPVDFGKNAVNKDKRLSSLIENAVENGVDKDFRTYVLPYMQRKDLLYLKESRIKSIASRASARALVTFGIKKIAKIDSEELLMNSLRSAVGVACLSNFNLARDIRNRNTQCYIDSLDNVAYGQPLIDEKIKPSFIRYTVLNNTKCENSYIAAAAKERGVELGIFNWSTPIHLCYPYNKILSFDRAQLSNSEHLGRRLLSLPVHPYINESIVKKIAAFLNDIAA